LIARKAWTILVQVDQESLWQLVGITPDELRFEFVPAAIVEGNCYPSICYVAKGLRLLFAALVRLDLSLAIVTKALLSRGGATPANMAFMGLYFCRHGSPPYSVLMLLTPPLVANIVDGQNVELKT